MAKEKRSAEELTDIVVKHLGIESVSVAVLADQVYGWNGFAMAARETEPDIHVKMQRAVEALRRQYDLQKL